MAQSTPAAPTTEHIDPVCGMSVDEKTAPARATYEGKTYYFCSKGCKAKFDANPGQFVK